MLTALPTVGRRDPTKTAGLGPVRPTVGSTVGITTSFSSRYPISIKGPSQRGDSAGPRVRQSLWWVLQGYVAQKNPPPLRTLQYPYAWGPMVILGGWVFLVREIPLYLSHSV